MTSVRSVGWSLLAPAIAVVVTVLATTLVLLFARASPGEFWAAMFTWPSERLQVDIVNQTAMIYIAGVAAAIGFRMGLFNIGLEGQYTLAAWAAAAFAGGAYLSGYPNVVLALVVAALAGGLWAGIAAVLKVTRGVSEVISTIMLNAIAVTLVGYLLNRYGVVEGNSRHTTDVDGSSMLVGIAPFGSRAGEIWALVVLAAIVGVAFWFVLGRTRFGFDLRASGQSASAARASGVNPRRMILVAMALSGAVAGLIWMPSLFGDAQSYGPAFQSGLGFTGLAVALLGRNHPVGIVFGAALFAFLAVQSNTLTLNSDVPPSVVQITQGVAVLAVVIAYEVVRRRREAAENRAVARELEGASA